MYTQRQSYTLEFKLKAIGEAKKGKRKDVCREYKLWQRSWRMRSNLCLPKNRKSFTLRLRRWEGPITIVCMDTAVFLWIKQARAMGTPISGALVIAKADSLAEKLNIRNFKANHGLLYHFKIRWSLIYKTICGESASVTPEVTREWRSNTLPTLLGKIHQRRHL